MFSQVPLKATAGSRLTFALSGLVIFASLTSSLVGQSIPVYVQKPFGNTAALASTTIAALQLQGVVDYGPFLIADIPPSATASITKSAALLGLTATPVPQFAEIRVRDFVLPATVGVAPDLPPDLQFSDYPGPTGLYLVQLRGPARQEWLDGLTAAGARLIHYLEPNTYLVAVAPAVANQLAKAPGVRHAVVYQPAYKVNAEFLPAQPSAPDTTAIVQLDANQPWEPLVAALEQESTGPVDYSTIGPYIDLTVTLTRGQLRTLAADSRVISVDMLGVPHLSDERSCQIVAGNHDSQQATNPGQYLNSWFHTVCGGCIYDLSSYIVNVVDTGLDNGSTQPIHQDIATRVNSWHDYFGANDTSSQPSHGELVAGIIAGYAASGLKDPAGFYYGMGIAPTVRLRISRIFNFAESTNLTPTLLRTLTTDAYNSGSYFQNQSWNLHNVSPPYTAIVDYEAYAQMVDYLVRDATGLNTAIRPVFISTAAGNLGEFPNPSVCPLCVRTPASSKNAVAMGASTLKRDEATPCTDANNPLNHVATLSARASQDLNRYKPEFVAPGTRIVSLQTQNTTPNYKGVCSDSASGIVPSTSNLYGFGSGTSYSTPLASGAAAILARYYHQRLGTADPSPAMVKAMMVVGGETMNLGTDDQTTQTLGQVPSHVYGWGRLGLQRIFDGTAVKALDEDHAVTPVRRFTASGQQYNFVYTVSNTSKPIRLVMAFTDLAGASGSGNNPFVNHISIAIFQGGRIWCDNGAIDSDGYMIPSTNCGFPDLDNNVKYVNVRPGSFSGQFTVNVTSGGINGKAVPGLDGSSNNQDFALFVYNAQ